MASVTLTEVWLHRANDPATVIKLEDATGIDVEASVTGNVYPFSTGRRWITTDVKWQNVEIVALHVLRTDVDILQSWVGDLLELRDPTGRQIWGIYQEFSIKESSETLLTYVNEITFVLNEVLGDVEV